MYTKQDDLVYCHRSTINKSDFFAADQIIVGKNKTRKAWNDLYRSEHGYKSQFPEKGEGVICLKNNKEMGIFNGMMSTCTKDSFLEDEADRVIKLTTEEGEFDAWRGEFDNIEPNHKYEHEGYDRFDYSYAITCHKSQGSEWDSVAVYKQPVGKNDIDARRWIYTAITRASKKLLLVDE